MLQDKRINERNEWTNRTTKSETKSESGTESTNSLHYCIIPSTFAVKAAISFHYLLLLLRATIDVCLVEMSDIYFTFISIFPSHKSQNYDLVPLLRFNVFVHFYLVNYLMMNLIIEYILTINMCICFMGSWLFIAHGKSSVDLITAL